MRSPSPHDSLDVLPEGKQYPKCAYKLYQRVHLTDRGYANWIARLRKAHAKILRSLKRQGFKGVSFDRMYIQNKHDTTSPLTLIEPDRTGEIVGMHCVHGHPLMMVMNECYLNEGHCHSGVEYSFDILFRKTDERGRKICYIATGFWDTDFEAIKRKQ